MVAMLSPNSRASSATTKTNNHTKKKKTNKKPSGKRMALVKNRSRQLWARTTCQLFQKSCILSSGGPIRADDIYVNQGQKNRTVSKVKPPSTKNSHKSGLESVIGREKPTKKTSKNTKHT